ncbi:MAG: hypothetical protein MUO76_22910, partial [Anaerolineaceae bacterium]|nr:hypothetical protein [Anaerolineaceae bacterium]
MLCCPRLAGLDSCCFPQQSAPTGDDQVCTLAGKQSGGGFANAGNSACQNGNLPDILESPVCSS